MLPGGVPKKRHTENTSEKKPNSNGSARRFIVIGSAANSWRSGALTDEKPPDCNGKPAISDGGIEKRWKNGMGIVTRYSFYSQPAQPL